MVIFQVELPAIPVAYAGSSPLGQAEVEAHIRMTVRTAKVLGPESSAPEVQAMQQAAVIMAIQCHAKPADQKTDCWLKYVAGLAGFLSADTLTARCASLASAEAACKELAVSLSGYTRAQSEFGTASLSCGDRPPVDPDLHASIKVRTYSTAANAKEEWDDDWGPTSMNRKDTKKLQGCYPDRVTFTYDAGHHLLEALEKPAYNYCIETAAASGDAVFEYVDYRAESGNPAAWGAIVRQSEALVRDKTSQ